MRYARGFAIGALLTGAFMGTLRAEAGTVTCPRDEKDHKQSGLELCVDMVGTAGDIALFPKGRLALRPNELLTVYVHHDARTTASVNASGQIGLSGLGIQGVSLGEPRELRGESYAGAAGATWSTFTFSPFTPGQVAVEIVATPEAVIELKERDLAGLSAFEGQLVSACLREPDGGACELHHALQSLDLREGETSAPQLLQLTHDLEAAMKEDPKPTAEQYSAATALVTDWVHPRTPEALNFTLMVEESYVGALRLGVTGIRGASQNRYEALQFPPPSDETEDPGPQIVQTAGGKWDSELVLTYTHYLWKQRQTDTYARIGILFGMGIVDLEALEVGLNSFYLGVDIGWHNLSVGPAVVLRRVNSLAEGLEIGTPVADNAGIITFAAWQPGFAIVVNAPLELMRTTAR